MEQIVANDSTGTHTLDSITTTGPYDPTPSSLNELALSGKTLTWSHTGSPRSAQRTCARNRDLARRPSLDLCGHTGSGLAGERNHAA
jgi:hypothetical protein